MTTATATATATTPTIANPANRRRAVITLVSDTEVRITREFDAPARLVFEASTRPEYIARWYGCGEMTMIRCDVDVREAGQQRFYSVNGRALAPIHAWSRQFEAYWNDRFDRLDDLLEELKSRKEEGDPP